MFAAVAALFATSCVADSTSDVAVTGGECDVTLSVVAPGADSRTIGDGLNATDLVCGVYDAAWNYLTSVDGTFTGSTTTTLSMRLVKGKTYNFVFWAQNPNAPYTLALGTVGEVSEPIITVDYSNVTANDDNLDAFFGKLTDYPVNGTVNETVYLKRPFAQINFGTADENQAKEFGFNVVDASAEATVTVSTMAYTNLSLRYGSVSGEQPVTFKKAAPATQTTNERLYVNNNSANYYWLAMNYILVPEQVEAVSLAQCDLTVEIDGQVPVKVSVPMAPAKRNWRTNLVGQLLTEQGNLTIEIKPIPVGDLPEPGNSAHELILAAAVGGEVTLTEDVVLEQGLNVAADMTINLNGHNITIAAAYNDANPTASSAISNNAILTLTGNGEIKAENNYTVRNYGTMIIDGVTIKNGVMNFGDLTVNSGNISNDRSGKHTIYGSAAKLTINGGTFHNGNPGNAGIFAYGGEVVINDGEFTIADGTATQGWTSCLLDAQGGAKYTIYGGLVKGDIRDYNKNTTVYGGTFTHSSVKNFLAAGYKAVSVDGLYYVLPAVVADAATAANVTAVTESVADVTTALATNNGEATLFTWNDVAYIAKYGEVVITSAAEEATTVRGVVSNENNDPNHPLTSAVIAEGVTNLGDRTFRRCYNLESVVLPSTLTTIGETGSGVFQACSSLKNIVLPESLTLLGVGTFQECTSLESINIPAGITRIEENCLRNTGLVEVEFHEGVTYFGAQAFRDCKQLKKVVIKAPKFTVEPNAFGVMSSALPGTIIYVENAEMKAYLESTLSYKSQFTVIAPEVVNSAVELNAAINTIADGGILVLGADFNFTTEEGGYYNNGGWRDGLGYSGDKSFTLDLNGHTLGNANGALNDYLVWFKNDGEKPNTITIKNGTLDAGTTAFCAIATSSSNKQTITINLEDVNLVNNNSNGAVAKIRAGAVLNVKAGTKITGKNSYTGIECVASTVNIYEGAELYQNGTSSSWGFLAGASWGGVINVYGGKGVSARGGFMAMTSGGTVNVHGGEWVANVDGTIGNNSNLYVLSAQNNKYESGYKGASIVNVTGGTFRGGMDAWILNDANVEKAELNISGGNFNANPTHYLTDGATATESNGVWTVAK